jgi:hypothetical protein
MLSGEMTLMKGNSDSRATVAAMELLPAASQSVHSQSDKGSKSANYMMYFGLKATVAAMELCLQAARGQMMLVTVHTMLAWCIADSKATVAAIELLPSPRQSGQQGFMRRC